MKSTISVASQTYNDLVDMASDKLSVSDIDLGYLLRCKAVAEFVESELKENSSSFVMRDVFNALMGVTEDADNT